MTKLWTWARRVLWGIVLIGMADTLLNPRRQPDAVIEAHGQWIHDQIALITGPTRLGPDRPEGRYCGSNKAHRAHVFDLPPVDFCPCTYPAADCLPDCQCACHRLGPWLCGGTVTVAR